MRTPLECGIWWYENDNLIAQQWYTCICYFWKLVGLVQSGDSYQPFDIAEKLLILGLNNKHSIATNESNVFVFVSFFFFFCCCILYFFSLFFPQYNAQLKTRIELRLPRKIRCFCSTSSIHGTCCVINPVRSHEGGRNDAIMVTTKKHYCGHLWHRHWVSVNQVMTATIKLSKWWLQLYN